MTSAHTHNIPTTQSNATRYRMLRLVLIGLSILLCTPTLSARIKVSLTPDTWNEADTLIAQGHYTKAYNLATQLLDKARRKDDGHAMLHATHLQCTAAAHYQEECIEKAIEAYQALIPTLHGTDKAVAYLLLAATLESYKETHLGYHSRASITLAPLTTATLLATPRDEMLLWDSHRIDRATRLCVDAALAEEEALKATRTESYDLLVPGDTMGLRLCPTLYDVVTHSLTDGMRLHHPMLSTLHHEDYDLLMGTAEEFVTLALPHDSTSHALWQLSLLQALTRHHLHTADAALRAHLDRQRMAALQPLTSNTALQSVYADGLQRIAESYATHSTEQAMILYLLACHYAPDIDTYTTPEQTERELERAALMERHINRICQIAPDSEWAQHATRLLQCVTHPYIKLQCHASLLPQHEATATLTVRNTGSITCRIVPRHAGETADNTRHKELMTRQPIAMHHMAASPEHRNPYAYYTTELPLPPLAAGDYFLIATRDETPCDTPTDEGLTSVTTLTVTGLKLSLLLDKTEGSYIAMAIDAATGRAVKACTMTLAERTGKHTHLIGTHTPDDKGYCTIPLPTGGNRDLYVEASDGTSRATAKVPYYAIYPDYTGTDEKSNTCYTLLTDRHTYKPGDRVQYTLIAYTHSHDSSHVEPHRPLTLTLHDTRSHKVASLQGTTDEWGHLSGTLTLAPEATPGRYTLRVTDKQRSHTHIHSINVEAFKAPTFEATLHRPTQLVNLSDTLTLQGIATTLTGMPVVGAKVQYEVQVTDAHLFARYYPSESYRHASTGTTTTDDKGMFTIAFHTEHPSTGDTDATYNYTVTAHITDLGGETQTTTTHFVVGHRTKRITFATPDHLIMHGDSIAYSLTTLNGEHLAENVTLRLSKLSTPHTDRIITPSEEPERERWTEERIISQRNEHTSTHGDNRIALTSDMPCGAYRLTITYTDGDNTYSEALHFDLWGKGKGNVASHTLYQAQARTYKAIAGGVAQLYIGTRHKDIHLHYYVRVGHNVVHKSTLTLTDETTLLRIPLRKEWQGRMAIDLVAVKDNVALTTSHTFLIEDPSRQLHLQLSPLTSPLEPGTTAHYTLSASDHSGHPVQTALTLSIYDAALDTYGTLHWGITTPSIPWGRMVELQEPHQSAWDNNTHLASASPTTPDYYELPTASLEIGHYGLPVLTKVHLLAEVALSPITHNNRRTLAKSSTAGAEETMADMIAGTAPHDTSTPPAPLHVRSDLSHTALFLPTLHTDEQGRATITLTAPDLLTTWHIKGLAHTKDMKYGHLDLNLITRKELMVQPHVPRFLYEGDTCHFTAKITHSGNEPVRVKLEMWTEDSTFTHTQSIVAEPTALAVAFPITAPAGATTLTYRITAHTAHHSDGEQGIIPLRPSRTLVTETMALYANGKEKHTFTFANLKGNTSSTLQHHSLTLDLVGNPAWYAIEALAPLCSEDNPSSERLFQRYYAASMATLLMERHPEVEGYTDFFKRDSLNALRTDHMQRLAALQAPDGGWAWMNGFDSDTYITLLIIKGMGELKAYAPSLLGEQERSLIERGIHYLDKHYDDSYDRMKQKPKKLDSHALYYLYTRTMHAETAFAQDRGTAHKHYSKLLLKAKPTHGTLMHKALSMLTLIRMGETKKAAKVAEVVAQAALHDEERGTYWRDNTRGWGWDADPIATQALLIEAFAQLGHSLSEKQQPDLLVGRMQQWLLGQKRTTQWSNSIATAQAVHALLTDTHSLPLTTTDDLSISVGGERIENTQDTQLAHTHKEWEATEITPSLAHVEISKHSSSPSWGAMTWQYYEDIDKVHASGTGLTLTTTYYKVCVQPKPYDGFTKVEHGAEGETLVPIHAGTQLKRGDRVRVLLHFSTDRDMDYVELHLQRPAAFEPISTHSGHYRSYGIGHYRSVENTQTTFYIHHLARGRYTLEHDYWVGQAGDYTCGISTIQCMYAPEFVATAESQVIHAED